MTSMLLKTARNGLLLVVLCGALSLSAQAEEQPPTVEQLKQDTEQLIDKLGHYSADQRDEAMHSIDETLAALDRRIDQLKQDLAENWDDMSDATRKETRKSLEALQAQRKTVGNWYDRLSASSSSAWDNVKKGFSEAYGKLSEAWQDAEDDMDDNQAGKRDQSI